MEAGSRYLRSSNQQTTVVRDSCFLQNMHVSSTTLCNNKALASDLQQHATGSYTSLIACNGKSNSGGGGKAITYHLSGNLELSLSQTSPIVQRNETISPTAKTTKICAFCEGYSKKKSQDMPIDDSSLETFSKKSATVEQHQLVDNVLFGIGSQFPTHLSCNCSTPARY